jgi:DNA-binding GntR family transcriptional regulator
MILDACAKREVEDAVRLIAEDIENSRSIILGLRADDRPKKRLLIGASGY